MPDLCTAVRIISLSETDVTDATLGASGLWLETRTEASGRSLWLHGQQVSHIYSNTTFQFCNRQWFCCSWWMTIFCMVLWDLIFILISPISPVYLMDISDLKPLQSLFISFVEISLKMWGIDHGTMLNLV